ncbi:MAG TPA: SDR family NAD(P)-dependent oxidoreductase [Ktedonosporobacter sp.]|nr:SDR family NAD(P)-dependent oxidoreductase [Ktedonosporobacter sp.]
MTYKQYDDPKYDTALAVVGMSGRFPGANSVEQLWENIAGGVRSIHFFTDEELLETGESPENLKNPNYVKAGSILEGVDLFDASFFGFNPREIEVMDPQQRLFLECSWEALEATGYLTGKYAGMVGVFGGAAMSSYLLNSIYNSPDAANNISPFLASLGNDKDSLATRVSYKLNLKGPSVTVQTYCSTSLVAVHMACQSLINYECDIALAGGAAINIPQERGYMYEEGSILSPDGYCRTFDANAQGSVLTNGVGVVAIKRFREALEDGDFIYAIIRGSATNNDGSQRVSYTAPGLDGQSGVMAEAMGNAGVDPASISYVEAHGTATELGDAVEVAAMIKAFRMSTQKKGYCAIGSIKPNIGHLDRASGVTGLIKTTLSLHHRLIPPSLNYETPNTDLDLENSPFYVNTVLTPWSDALLPRRASVSSFGVGGSNAHVVLEEAPEREPGSASRPWQLLLLSTKTESALQMASNNLAAYLKEHPEESLADIAYTLQTGRSVFNHRRLIVCQDHAGAIEAIEAPSTTRSITLHDARRDREVVFLFPGVGEQYIGMAHELYEHEPRFRETVDHCCQFLKTQQNLDLQALLTAEREQPAVQSAKIDFRAMLKAGSQSTSAESDLLKHTAIAQPAVFIIEYALAQLLMEWGIRPQAMLGYSVGEYVAACLAGVLSLEDALTVVARRAQLIAEQPEGVMLVVALPEEAVRPYLTEQICLAIVNGPNACVLAGPAEAIEQLEVQLEVQEIACRRVETTHAFHSTMLNAVREPLTTLMRTITLHVPQIPYISNVTGTWITDDQATDPTYWAQHMCQTVYFAQGIAELLQKPERAIVEVGMGQSLSSFVKQHPSSSREHWHLILSALPALNDRQPDYTCLLSTLGRLWLAGVNIDWKSFYQHERRLKVVLPTYPFERKRYWLGPEKHGPTRIHLANFMDELDDGEPPLLEHVADWHYLPTWKKSLPRLPDAANTYLENGTGWLIFADAYGVGARIAAALRQRQQQVVIVTPGSEFARLNDDAYSIHPDRREEYERFLQELRDQGRSPGKIVHCWTLTDEPSQAMNQEIVDHMLERGFYSLLNLVQSLGTLGMDTCDISMVTNYLQNVSGSEIVCPEKALITGHSLVIPQEFVSIRVRSIDIVLQEALREDKTSLRLLVEELTTVPTDPIIAFRGHSRWEQAFEATPLERKDLSHPDMPLQEGGVYLITGGMGGVGLGMAECIARAVPRARFVLVGRSGMPPREEWAALRELHSEDDKNLGRQLHTIRRIEEDLGGQVLTLRADVTNEDQMRAIVEQTLATFGQLNGVLHAAGTPGVGMMQLKTREHIQGVFAPKVTGTIVLDHVLADVPIDFLVLFSSVTSAIGGGPGQVDYCSANAFMDVYAQRNANRLNRKTISINWGEWRWNGWEFGLEGYDKETQEHFKAHRLKYGFSFEDGGDALLRILGQPVPQMYVSSQEFFKVLRNSRAFSAATMVEGAEKKWKSQQKHPRPSLSSSYVVPRNETEQTIASLWEMLLGIEPVGIYDNFFELGGNSLLGIDLMSRMRKTLQLQTLPSYVLYEAPTVSTLAEYIEKSKAPATEDKLDERSARRRESLHQRVHV